jgi:hypothetical protein
MAEGCCLRTNSGAMTLAKFPLSTRRENHMLWTIAVVLIVLWVLGLVSSYTMGGFIHLLIVLAIVVVLIRIIQGKKILK